MKHILLVAFVLFVVLSTGIVGYVIGDDQQPVAAKTEPVAPSQGVAISDMSCVDKMGDVHLSDDVDACTPKN